MESLIEHLLETGVLQTPRVAEAFRAIDRRDFVAPVEEQYAYEDHALAIGFGQTISQPTTVAIMLELLAPQPGEKVLDVGSGSGWTTALIAHIVGPMGRVFGVERIPELAAFGAENLLKYTLPQATSEEAGGKLGLPHEASFDRILVSAAADEVPAELIDQLTVDGTMVMPVGSGLDKVTKTGASEIEIERVEGFAFVPLVLKKP